MNALAQPSPRPGGGSKTLGSWPHDANAQSFSSLRKSNFENGSKQKCPQTPPNPPKRPTRSCRPRTSKRRQNNGGKQRAMPSSLSTTT
jgi:hypothetical protein